MVSWPWCYSRDDGGSGRYDTILYILLMQCRLASLRMEISSVMNISVAG